MSIPCRKPRRRRRGQGQEDFRTPRGDTPARGDRRRDGARRVNQSRSNSPAVHVAQFPSVEVAVDRTAAVAASAGGAGGADRPRVSLTANPNRSPTRSPCPRSPSPRGGQSPSSNPRRVSPCGPTASERLRAAASPSPGQRSAASPCPVYRAALSPSPRADAAPASNSQRQDGGRDRIQTRAELRVRERKARAKARAEAAGKAGAGSVASFYLLFGQLGHTGPGGGFVG